MTTELKILKELNFRKGEDCYDIASKIEDCFNEMINHNFESVDATLNKNIKVKISIEYKEDLK